MPERDIKDGFGFDFFITSRLSYSDAEDADVPRSHSAVRSRADMFAQHMKGEFESSLGGTFQLRTVYARHGSAAIGHAGHFFSESRDQWESARELFGQFAQDAEEWVATEWMIQESLARKQIKVSISYSEPKEEKPTIAPASLADAVKKQQERMWRMISTAAFVAFLFGLIGSAAWWNFWFMHEEVRLLREEIAARAVSQGQPPQPVIVTYPPPQPRVTRAPAPQRETRRYSSSPE